MKGIYKSHEDTKLLDLGGGTTRRILSWNEQMMTVEVGMRFLTDYLSGDTYFRIGYPKHNLDRARNQLALYRDVRRHDQMMAAFIQELM